MDQEPTLPPPVYAPEVVAEAILHAAEMPERDVTVGGGGKIISVLGQHMPRLTDKALETQTFLDQQKSGRPAADPDGALYAPTFGLQERGRYDGHVKEASLYTRASRHPLVVGALVAGTGLLIAALAGGDTSSGSKRY